MRFHPNYTLNVIKDKDFNTEIQKIEEELALYVSSGKYISFDNTSIYYEYFLAKKPKANIVIVHGLSEFTKKFYEFIYYALNQGYNVFLYDQRCHGLSDRLTDDDSILHVDDFVDYAMDLELFIDKIVIPTEDIPVFIYSQSMGGAVSALYLANHSEKIKKAVFSVPLLEPVIHNVPYSLAQKCVKLGRIILGSKKKFFLSKDFDPEIEYNDTYGSSKVRFDHNIKLRKENEKYQSSPMSFGWVYNSLMLHRKILKKNFVEKINVPILLISAEMDTVVKNEPQRAFARLCKNCEFIQMDNVTHALLASESTELEKILNHIFSFYENK